MTTTALDVTRLLRSLADGDEAAADRLLPVVYDELRRLARRRMASERRDHTLDATALVHECWLKLSGPNAPRWNDRRHFFAVAAEAMRRLLVDHARRRRRQRHGGDHARQPLELADLTVAEMAARDRPEELLALDDALRELEVVDPRMARVVALRFFAGLGVEETARAMEVSPRTVKREWTCARAWLYRALSGA